MFAQEGNGPVQFKILMENVEKRGIPVLYAHRGTELIQNPETKEILPEDRFGKMVLKEMSCVPTPEEL